MRPPQLSYQTHRLLSRVDEGQRVVYTYESVDMDLKSAQTKAKRTLSSIHDRYEASRFEYSGAMIDASLETRINAKSILDDFKAGMLTAIEWRGKQPVKLSRACLKKRVRRWLQLQLHPPRRWALCTALSLPTCRKVLQRVVLLKR